MIRYKVYKKGTIDFDCNCGKCDKYKGFFHADLLKFTDDLILARKVANDQQGVIYSSQYQSSSNFLEIGKPKLINN